jgi:hypothetical protein
MVDAKMFIVTRHAAHTSLMVNNLAERSVILEGIATQTPYVLQPHVRNMGEMCVTLKQDQISLLV